MKKSLTHVMVNGETIGYVKNSTELQELLSTVTAVLRGLGLRFHYVALQGDAKDPQVVVEALGNSPAEVSIQRVEVPELSKTAVRKFEAMVKRLREPVVKKPRGSP